LWSRFAADIEFEVLGGAVVRLFIAVNFSDEVKNALLKAQAELRRCAEIGNFSHQENLHLTLVFLGEIAPAKVSGIKSIMDAARMEVFSLVIEGMGRFRGSTGDIWWAGVKVSEELIRLQRQLTDGLLGAGFDVDTRPYKPHLTLAREVVLREGAYRDALQKGLPKVAVPVTKISLMKSERIQGKLTYTEIFYTAME
jgi:2'-5' RNA ligase